MAGKIYVGIGGWTFPPWRGGVFYPEKHPQARELEYASRQVTSIEINGTYYGSQKPTSFAKWHDETPDDFIFAVKGPRFATNRKILSDAGPSIEKFFESGVTLLKNKLGPLNWQFMGTKKFDPGDFEGFLKRLPKTHDGVTLRHAVEVRHESFANPEFVAMARAYGVAIIFGTHSIYPQIADLTAPFVYARLQQSAATEVNGYADEELAGWADATRGWARGAAPDDFAYAAPQSESASPAERDVFIYMIAGHKEHNPNAAKALLARL